MKITSFRGASTIDIAIQSFYGLTPVFVAWIFVHKLKIKGQLYNLLQVVDLIRINPWKVHLFWR